MDRPQRDIQEGRRGGERTIITVTTKEANDGSSERETQIQFCPIGGVGCCHYYLCVAPIKSLLKCAKPTGMETTPNIKTSSDWVTDLSLLNIRWGLPYYFDGTGRRVLGYIL